MSPNNRPSRGLATFIFSSLLWVLQVHASLPAKPSNATNSSDWMSQGWLWTQHPSSQNVPVPVTQQCETVDFNWQSNTATGPNPQAPYTLQIYTSAFVFPFVVNVGSSPSFKYQVPFGPGTLWQACMFDGDGQTGGCGEIHTMIPGNANCKNATFPLGPLNVDARVANGIMSQYGWVDQCTDIQLTPKNGTPPYIMTIAPSLHPPLNFTLTDMNPRNWTVSLSWASPFFISMVDSAGNFWANGPLHSGGGGSTSTACLSNLATLPSSSTSSHSGIKAGAAVGAAFGGLIVGALAGLAAAFVFLKRRGSTSYSEKREPDSRTGGLTSPLRSVSSRNNLITGDGSVDENFGSSVGISSFNRSRMVAAHPTVQPFTERGQQQYSQKAMAASGRDDAMEMQPAPPGTAVSEGTSSSSSRNNNQIYVVHHDGGRAPVTVYHADGTQVVELPPRYANDTEAARASGSHTRSTSDTVSPSTTRNSIFSSNAATVTSSDQSDATTILSPVRRPGSVHKPPRTDQATANQNAA